MVFRLVLFARHFSVPLIYWFDQLYGFQKKKKFRELKGIFSVVCMCGVCVSTVIKNVVFILWYSYSSCSN